MIASGYGCALDEPGDTHTGADPAELASNTQAVSDPDAGIPLVDAGQVLNVTAAEGFKYFEVRDTVCRSGSQAGVSVRVPSTPTNKVLFYLQGGGACFNTQTCQPQVNKDSIAVNRRSESAGIFDFTSPFNPFNDYNVVYVPYCTGDFHLGNKQSSVPLGPSNQQFRGRANLEKILKSVAATFPNTSNIVIAGSSAGGGGATGSVAPVKRAFAGKDLDLFLIDDAGPLLSAGANITVDYMPGNEQTKWKNLWGLDTTVIPECGSSCTVNNNFLPAIAKNVQSQLGKGRKPVFVGGKQDISVAELYSNARADVYGPAGLINFDTRNALSDYRTRMAGTWNTYYVVSPAADAQQHMWLVHPNFYDNVQQTVVTREYVLLFAWISDYINDRPVVDVGL